MQSAVKIDKREASILYVSNFLIHSHFGLLVSESLSQELQKYHPKRSLYVGRKFWDQYRFQRSKGRTS